MGQNTAVFITVTFKYMYMYRYVRVLDQHSNTFSALPGHFYLFV